MLFLKNMKIFKLFPFILSLVLTGCFNQTSTRNYTTFKDYIEIVNHQTKNSQDIFIFTSTTCPHCQRLLPLIDRFILENQNENLNIYELNVDSNKKINGTTKFLDSTMGVLSGDSKNDGLKQLDNRISKYIEVTNTPVGIANEIFTMPGSTYSYVFTPLIILYQNQIEVKIINNVEQIVQMDKKNNFIYESFLQMITFPEESTIWHQPFDLTYYS